MSPARKIALRVEDQFKQTDAYKTCVPYMNKMFEALDKSTSSGVIHKEYNVRILVKPDDFPAVASFLGWTILCTTGLRVNIALDAHDVVVVGIRTADLISILY